MSALLEVADIRHGFRGLQVLKGVSLTVETGTITGLIGPNGAGKSTLFNIVSGFLAQDAGEVRYDGQSINGVPVAQRSLMGLVRTFQTPQVFAHLSVRENLIAGGYKRARTGMLGGLLGTRGARAEATALARTADETCERFGLTEVRDRPAGKLPAGQQRLLELARACIAGPRLLCLDEPSSGLNTEEVNRLMSTLQRLNREGITLLLVSHDMNLVAIASHIHVLCFGEILCSGPLRSVQADPRVREAYLGV